MSKNNSKKKNQIITNPNGFEIKKINNPNDSNSPANNVTLESYVNALDEEVKSGGPTTLPNQEDQVQALKDFSKGKLTYAEMRDRCG